jgi:hypothetical protein
MRNACALAILFLIAGLPGYAKRDDAVIIEDPNKIAEEVQRLPRLTPFAIVSLSFYEDSLFAASNVGLLQITDGSVRRLYRWNKLSPEIAGAWTDPVHHLLFVHDPQAKLIRIFDGSTWTPAPVPSVPRNFHSRGDVTTTFRSFASDKNFYLVGQGAVFRWAADERTWKSQLLPPVPELSAVVDAFYAHGKIFSIVRNEPFHALAARQPSNAEAKEAPKPERKPAADSEDLEPSRPKEESSSDTIYYYDPGRWHTVPNRAGAEFFTMNSSSTGQVGYVCTESHEVLRVAEEAVEKMKQAPACEQVLADPTRVVIYSREGFLVWEGGSVWLRLGAPPVLGPEPEHPLAFAVQGNTVAYAISSIVDRKHSERKGTHFEFTPPTRLWISNKDSMQAVTIPGVQPPAYR